ncbi:hypothetical protein LIA77_00309 [Sarocladium implicatum]|nr:hypothetical protein LIA77_00309 [Sarocladium implicatum]
MQNRVQTVCVLAITHRTSISETAVLPVTGVERRGFLSAALELWEAVAGVDSWSGSQHGSNWSIQANKPHSETTADSGHCPAVHDNCGGPADLATWATGAQLGKSGDAHSARYARDVEEDARNQTRTRQCRKQDSNQPPHAAPWLSSLRQQP